MTNGGEQPGYLFVEDGQNRMFTTGLLLLPSHHVCVVRWNVFITKEATSVPIGLVAARSVDDFKKFLERLKEAALRMNRDQPVWRVVSGALFDCSTVDRSQDLAEPLDGLVFPDDLRRRLRLDVLEFFAPETRELFARMRVPYRRGVLLWGPPGNGKTSIIRALAQEMRGVSALFLRPHAGFHDDDLTRVISDWKAQAPAILAIEDLDSLFNQNVRLSTLLNALDGLEVSNKGLMLLASSNHPDKLDPALHMRPGRFDINIEMSVPGRDLRELYFARHLPGLIDEVKKEVLLGTQGMSFAYLREIVTSSAYQAIRTGRSERTDGDVRSALAWVQMSFRSAVNGFAPKNETGFGFTA